MVTDIQGNKDRYINLLMSIKRDSDIAGLINMLENKGFFTSPASTKYHAAYEGGLCEHSLNVYDNMVKIIEYKYNDIPFPVFLEESVIITALCHDFDKIGLYEKSINNVKVYKPDGKKYDELGNFEWESQPGYKVTQNKNKFIFGTHGQNSERITSLYIPLSDEESCAIVNHHSVYDNPNIDITTIYNKYNLACILHVADMLATYVDERTV